MAVQALLAVHNARIVRDYATCKSPLELAAEHGLTERQIERILASIDVPLPADRCQATLF